MRLLFKFLLSCKKTVMLSSICVMPLFSICLVAQTFQGDSWQEAKANNKGAIFINYVETPGFVYKDQSGNLTGICVDLMKDFAQWVYRSKGVMLDAKFAGKGNSFKQMYNNVKGSKGGVFGLGNVTITDSRRKEVSFSPPFIGNIAILITQKGVPTLHSLSRINERFKGLTAYTAKGTLNEERIKDLKSKYYPDMAIAYAESGPATLDKVLQDENGFAYLDVAFYIDAVKRKKPVKRHAVADHGAEEYGIIMPKGSDWEALMKEFFASEGGYTKGIAYKKILTTHLGATGMRLISSF